MKKLNLNLDLSIYTNYRLFLKDALKKLSITVQQTAISCDIDPSLLTKILKGERPLNFDDALSLSQLLNLNNKQFDHFDLLRRFNNTKSKQEKKYLALKLYLK